ncbi:restriction endonuclease subunit S [Roseovarius spongiae]|uniref:Restriction endonuclease subunit S n=1 Tax=Roseovarius spongiae TaxID=2320272 RepID=A0A3A8ASG9_9RHOB|nr:restriction endonuclease subunit S [Roseovarius spongiae]RKF13071.1 restriction endonuclease subunit S [Roseovarius spongiae]
MSESLAPTAELHEIADINPETLPGNMPGSFAFRYVDLSAADRGAIDWGCVGWTTFLAAPSRARRIANSGDALFGTVRPYLQSHGQVPQGEQGPIIASTGFSVVRARRGYSDPSFLFHTLMGSAVFEQANRHAIGSSYPAVTEKDVARFRVFSPPAAHQSKIAEILDTLDAAIRGTEAVVAKLKAMKQGLLHDLLTRGIDANGDLRPPQPEAPHLYKQTPLGWLPKEWGAAKLPGLAMNSRPVIRTGPFGSSLKGEHWRETGRPVITIGSFGENGFIRDELLFIDEKKAVSMLEYEVHAGDLVFSRVADVGRSLVVDERQAGWIMSSNLMRISVDPKRLLPSLLHVQLRHSVRLRKQMSQLVNSAGRDVANSAVLLALDIAVPQVEEQTMINQAIRLNNNKLASEERQLNKLRLQKSGLMNDLLTGRVSVTPLL